MGVAGRVARRGSRNPALERSSMAKPRVLYIAHAHPEYTAGGGEGFALELFRGMREGGDYECALVARDRSASPHTGTPLAGIQGRPGETIFHGITEDFDYFLQVSQDKSSVSIYLKEVLESMRPEVVHFQHTLHLGVECIRLVRNIVPHAAIVYTLHEYIAICAADGQMVRTFDRGLCRQATPRRCHECLPAHSSAEFKVRELFIKAHFRLVDQFIAPSKFLRDRYVNWGLEPAKVRLLHYGRSLPRPSPARVLAEGERRLVFGFFGSLHANKGILVLLEAMQILAESEQLKIHLYIHGANLELQTDEYRAEFDSKLLACSPNTTFLGRYQSADLPELMAAIDWVVVPSVWWENSPLVIQEANMHGRPVICSDIGGMTEKVTNGVDGLHFRVNDARSLARTMAMAAADSRLWERLRSAIKPVLSIAESVAAHGALYDSLLAERAGTVRSGHA